MCRCDCARGASTHARTQFNVRTNELFCHTNKTRSHTRAPIRGHFTARSSVRAPARRKCSAVARCAVAPCTHIQPPTNTQKKRSAHVRRHQHIRAHTERTHAHTQKIIKTDLVYTLSYEKYTRVIYNCLHCSLARSRALTTGRPATAVRPARTTNDERRTLADCPACLCGARSGFWFHFVR